jgi:hypothetical protein
MFKIFEMSEPTRPVLPGGGEFDIGLSPPCKTENLAKIENMFKNILGMGIRGQVGSNCFGKKQLEKISCHDLRRVTRVIIITVFTAPQPGCSQHESLDLSCSHFQVLS